MYNIHQPIKLSINTMLNLDISTPHHNKEILKAQKCHVYKILCMWLP